MATVKFNVVDEFLDEIKREFEGRPIPPYTILRVTNLLRPIPNLGPIQSLFIVATIKIREDIIRLEQYCGQIWGIGGQDEATLKKAEGIYDKIKKACQRLEIRAGVYEGD